MTREQQELKARFLEPETRDGYYINAKMKAAWKEMLDIVEMIDRICAKYELNYTLAGGTLLGAIRHKGFIPWDDDIDLDMPRKDYNKLVRILEKELKPPYVLQTFFTDSGRTSTFLQIRNPKTTAINPEWIRSTSRFNMGIGIDIFPIDGVPETVFSRFVTKSVNRISSGLMVRRIRPIGRFSFFNYLKYVISVAACFVFGAKGLWRLREWCFARNDIEKCTLCGEYSFRMNSVSERWSPKVYDSYLTLPFEYLMLKVPVGYDEVLMAKYGDWRKPAQIKGYHEPLVLDTKRPYKEILVEKFGYKPEWVENLP